MIRADTILAERYRLESRIAVGGMGEVWRGTDLVLDRPVAIKVLHLAEAEGYADAAARFRAEARHVGSLSHAGIASVYDFCESDRGYPPFLVMELVEGPSLAGLLTAGPLDPMRTMDIVAQTAAALGEAHAAGLVHRDIKPANLLLAPGDQVKIIDFGIAQGARSAEVTGTGAVIGSPAYLAPERVRGGAATPASDLYSLGIVTYECLAGAPPFSGPGMDVAHAHVHQPMPPLPPDVPPQLASFVERLTAKDPAGRPARAADVAEHARHLRDTLRSNRTLRLPALHPAWEPFSSPGHRAASGGSRRHDPPSGGDPGTPDRDARPGFGHARARPRFGLVVPLAILAIAVLAGLVGWQLKGVLGPSGGQPPSHTVTNGPSQPAGTVNVSSALVGQDAQTVKRELAQQGLQPQLVKQPSDQQPGTVIAVTPTGPLVPGTVVTIGVATSHGHGHDHGNGQGDNGGGG